MNIKEILYYILLIGGAIALCVEIYAIIKLFI